MLGLGITGLVVAVVGFVVALVLNVFVFDEFDAYGEVAIPGQESLELPEGEVSVSFHTVVNGGTDGGFYTPALGLSITPPDGVNQEQVVITEQGSSTTSVNNDVRAQVFAVQIPQAGDYVIRTSGDMSGYIAPRLAFGHGSQYWWLLWVFGAVFVIALIDVLLGSVWLARARRTPVPLQPSQFAGGIYPYPDSSAPPSYAPASYSPNEDGIRLEQLKTLAALRESGALTEAEFQAEKRRLLGS